MNNSLHIFLFLKDSAFTFSSFKIHLNKWRWCIILIIQVIGRGWDIHITNILENIMTTVSIWMLIWVTQAAPRDVAEASHMRLVLVIS